METSDFDYFLFICLLAPISIVLLLVACGCVIILVEISFRYTNIILKNVMKALWNISREIMEFLTFIFGHDEDDASRLICDLCKQQTCEGLQYCHDCKLYICSICYGLHQRLEACRDHQTSTCKETNMERINIPISEKYLEEASLRSVEVVDNGLRLTQFISVSLMTLKRAIYMCVFFNGKVYFVNIDDGKPDYKLSEVYHSWNKKNFLTLLPKSGFGLIVSSGNDIQFIAAYVPLFEKLKNLSKILSYRFSKIRYTLTASSTVSKIDITENVYRNVRLSTLYTEFNNGIVVLALKNNKKFGLVPNWSLTYYSHEGKFVHKCFLKRSSEGKLLFQSPVCMVVSVNNTLVICDSAEQSKRVVEVDKEGNVVSEVNLEGKLSGTITAVSADDEGNIYVSDEQSVVQITSNGQNIREILSIENNRLYNYIEDICFSEKTHKLYVVFEQNFWRFTVVAFSFVELQ